MAVQSAAFEARSLPTGTASDPSHLSASQLLRLVRRKWLWVLGGLVLGGAAAATYWYYAPRQYVSTGEIFVMRKGSLGYGPAESSSAESVVSDDLLASHMKLIQSAKIIESALNGSDQDLASLPSIEAARKTDETPVQYVARNLDVRRGGEGRAKNAHVITIGLQHTSDVDAKLIVDAVIASYKRFLDSTFQDVNLETLQLIESTKGTLLKELHVAEKTYQEFRKNSPLLTKGDESGNVHRIRYEQIQAELSETQLEAAQIRGRLDAVTRHLQVVDETKGSDVSRLTVIDDSSAARIGLLLTVERGESTTAEFQAKQPERLETARAELTTLTELRSLHDSMLAEVGDKHPELVRLRSRIKSIEAFIEGRSAKLDLPTPSVFSNPQAIVTAYVEFLNNDLKAMELKEKELLAAATATEELAKNYVQFELQDEILRRDMIRQEELYKAVVDRLEQLNMSKEYGGFINEIIVDPDVGELTWPSIPIVAAGGLLLGLVIGASGIAISVARDGTFRSSDEVKTLLDLPILANVSKLKRSYRKRKEGERQSAVADSLVCFHAPLALEAESFRLLRTQLLVTGDKQRQIVQFTSANQGDGKSTLVANLAVSLAQAGKRVLLIDCDLRRPAVAKQFGVAPAAGLVELLAGKAKLTDVVVPTEVSNLHVLTNTSPASNPEVFESRAFLDLLGKLRTHFDMILIDSPPLLPVADSCIIARHVDGVVLVINIKRTTRSQAAWSREMLTEINAPLLGAVVNGIDSTSAYGYEYASYGRSRYAYTAPATLPTSPTSTPPPPTPSAASASPPSKRKAKTKPTELADAVSSADPS